jgi:PKD domain
VRHANGRDWWVVAAKQYSNKYHFVLLGPEGASTQSQTIGQPTWSGAGGEIVFSPDGSKMARFNTRDDLRLFDFDRCTGTLSNPRHVPIQDDADNKISAGLAFSLDGRFLYAAEVTRILQFDLHAPDLAASMTTVAEAEPPLCFLSGSIGYLELGPDGIIYGRPLSGQNCMHRILHPERPATECQLQQNYYQLEYPYKNLPHFPNFRLGPLDGSTCDSLGLDNLPRAAWRYDRTAGSAADFTSLAWGQPNWWAWDFADPASGALNASSEQNPAHQFSAPGAYQVCLTVGSPYGTDTKCKTVWVGTSSAAEPGAGGTVRVWPNPSTGIVQWTGTSGAVRVRVFDAMGRLALEQAATAAHLDLGQLPHGLYRLQILGEDGTKPLFNGQISLMR